MQTYHTEEREAQSKFYSQMGDTITLARKKLGITQDDLAWMLGLSRVSVVNIEAGKQRTPLHFIIALAKVLNIFLPELIPEFNANIKTIEDLKKHKALNSFNKLCSHEAMEHIVATNGKEYYICPTCNYSKIID